MANWDFNQYGRVELVQDDKGFISLRAEQADSNQALVFAESELRSLWATIVGASGEKKQAVSTYALVLFTDKFKDNGRLIAEKAAITGGPSDYGIAYESWQVTRAAQAFDVECHVKYGKPQLWVLAAPRPAKPGKPKKAPPAPLQVKRIEAPSVQAAPPKGNGKLQAQRRPG